MSTINFKGDTDSGKVRKNNEDTFIAEKIWDENHLLLVVIDGVGGHEGGEFAAEIAREKIKSYLLSYPNGERLNLLKQAVNEANNSIFEERLKSSRYANMSCVLTACLIEIAKKKAHMIHVGDTRLYVYSEEQLVKISHDHSIVGYREEIGDLTEEDAMNHPQRNLIGRDVGSELHRLDDEDFIEATSFTFEPGNTMLLCTDGLSDLLKSSEMVDILNKDIPVEQKVKLLIEEANDKGGKDNITVIVAEYEIEQDLIANNNIRIQDNIQEKDISEENEVIIPEYKEEVQVKKETGKRWIGMIIIGLLCLFAGIIAGWYLSEFYDKEKNTDHGISYPVIEDTIDPGLNSFVNEDTFLLDNKYRIFVGEDELKNYKIYHLKNGSDSVSAIILLDSILYDRFLLKELLYIDGQSDY